MLDLETDLERQICADPRWIEGGKYGKPRPGHPEGSVEFHVPMVLANVDKFYGDSPLRSSLRLIALVHDNFKAFVDRTKPKEGENHHGMVARRFAEQFIVDPVVLDVIELHDDAFNAWKKRNVGRAQRLLARLGTGVARELYLAFYRCDNGTEGKTQEPYEWFLELCK